MRKKVKLVCGWGINDVDYKVTRTTIIDGKQKIVWCCPYYQDWLSMIARCFDSKYQKKRPTYIGCTITEDWKYLSNFIKWVDSQPNKDWQNCSPDKDYLIEGNKHYSPETVVYIPKGLNLFIIDRGNARGDCMIGVDATGREKKPYRARCSNPFTKKLEHVGYFATELEAHLAWKAKKHEHSLQFADLQDDPRVAKVLMERYAPDTDWIKGE